MNTSQPKPSLPPITRRRFVQCAISLGAVGSNLIQAAETKPQFRAAIIGHTGQGNYGHEHDLIFNDRDDVRVVAVADPDPVGRSRAATRSRALRQYADYVQMLEQEKPDLVCVAPRWTDQHHAMALAALRVGAHVYLEKPITRTLAEADELLTAADRAGLKVVVAHQMRLAPNILALKAALEGQLIGELVEIRAHGKQDRRAGGEDLIVLGVHIFDLMRYYAGEPSWCAARVLQNGHEITLADAHSATEDIGPVAGDDIVAEFAFPKGVHATFTSCPRRRETAGPWGLELRGTQGAVGILLEMIPRIYTLKAGRWTVEGKADEWRLWEQDPTLGLPEEERGFARANGRVVDDWLAAIREQQQPVCSGTSAMRALEMAMAVFAAGLTKGRVALPLKNRQHPLFS